MSRLNIDLKHRAWQIGVSLVLALGAFLWVVGPLVLNPQNIGWLGGGFDPTQHYLGWTFFRQSPWTIPLGLNPNFGMDISSSIVYSDSIPLFAIVFKVFTGFLSTPFQYFGFWILLCFLLQGYFAWRLVALLDLSPIARWAASLLFVFSPPLFWRIGLHAALVAHWLILAALYLNFRPNQNRRTLYWVILVCLSALVHFYLLTMVVGMWIASMLDQARLGFANPNDKNTVRSYSHWIRELAIVGLLAALVMWQAGYFAVSRSATATLSYGVSRMNLLAPFDARHWSYVLPSIADAQGRLSDLDMSARAYENFSYWGAGVLGLFVCVLCLWVIKRRNTVSYPASCISTNPAFLDKQGAVNLSWQSHGCLYGLLILFTLFALSNQIGIGTWSFEFALPNWVYQIASMYRASSRFFWPSFYALLFLAIAVMTRYLSSKAVTIGLVMAALLQIMDTGSGWRDIRKLTMRPVQTTFATELRDPFWDIAGKRYQRIVRIPVDPLWVKVLPPHWSTWAAYAAQYGLQTNSAYLARQYEEKLEQSNQSLQQNIAAGKWDDQTLYILGDQEVKTVLKHLDPERDLLATINGHTVLAPDWMTCTDCPVISPRLMITKQMVQTQMGVPVSFAGLGNGKYFLQGANWAYPEAWGAWALGDHAKLTLPLPAKTGHQAKPPTHLILQMRALINPQHPIQKIGIQVNGQKQLLFELDRDTPNSITIALSDQVIANGYVQLEFDLPTAKRPQDLGMGNDDRWLSVGLISAQFSH